MNVVDRELKYSARTGEDWSDSCHGHGASQGLGLELPSCVDDHSADKLGMDAKAAHQDE